MRGKYNKSKRTSRKFRKDHKGALEGLPLYLIILVIIAVIAIAIIATWLGGIGTGPKSIKTIKIEVISPPSEDNDKVVIPSGQDSVSAQIEITVYDQDNKKLDGAVVTLTGPVDTTSDTTKDGGKVTFNIDVELPPNVQTGEIKVEVKKSDYTSKTTTILVYRG